MALDLPRALRSADVAPALELEFASARGAHPAFDRAAAAVLRQIDDIPAAAEGRGLARAVALLLQAALLHRQSPAAVFDAFCDSRLAAASEVFGLVPMCQDHDAMIARAMPEESP